MPAWANRSVYQIDRYCTPRSLWWTSGSAWMSGLSWSTCSNASSARSLRSEVDARQPTIRRENTSTTTATYTNPRQVATYVWSATHD